MIPAAAGVPPGDEGVADDRTAKQRFTEYAEQAGELAGDVLEGALNQLDNVVDDVSRNVKATARAIRYDYLPRAGELVTDVASEFGNTLREQTPKVREGARRAIGKIVSRLRKE